MIKNINNIEAERIISALGDGVPIPDYVLTYSSEVNTSLLKQVKEHLVKVKRGLTIARFVKGDYGSGKSHFLSIVREIALRDNYIVSYFDLRAREGFDMIERIFSKLIKEVSIFDKRQGDAEFTVLDHIFKKWAEKSQNIDDDISKMELDTTNRDFINIIKIYGKVLSKSMPRYSDGIDILEIVNRWFQAESLTAVQRSKINVNNNITVRNARDTLNSLAVFFHSIGYLGWVVLIDEQEIIPTLMAKRKRDLSNENLKVIIDTQHKTKYFYYLFATTPEFFTDPDNGINAYPALRQRVSEKLEINPITTKDMIEAGKRIKEIYCIANSDFGRGILTENDIKRLADIMDETFKGISATARIYIVSLIKLLQELHKETSLNVIGLFRNIAGRVWDDLEKNLRKHI